MVESAPLRPEDLRGNEKFQLGDPLMKISDGVGGPLEPGEPAFQGKPVLGKLFSLL